MNNYPSFDEIYDELKIKLINKPENDFTLGYINNHKSDFEKIYNNIIINDNRNEFLKLNPEIAKKITPYSYENFRRDFLNGDLNEKSKMLKVKNQVNVLKDVIDNYEKYNNLISVELSNATISDEEKVGRIKNLIMKSNRRISDLTGVKELIVLNEENKKLILELNKKMDIESKYGVVLGTNEKMTYRQACAIMRRYYSKSLDKRNITEEFQNKFYDALNCIMETLDKSKKKSSNPFTNSIITLYSRVRDDKATKEDWDLFLEYVYKAREYELDYLLDFIEYNINSFEDLEKAEEMVEQYKDDSVYTYLKEELEKEHERLEKIKGDNKPDGKNINNPDANNPDIDDLDKNISNIIDFDDITERGGKNTTGNNPETNGEPELEDSDKNIPNIIDFDDITERDGKNITGDSQNSNDDSIIENPDIKDPVIESPGKYPEGYNYTISFVNTNLSKKNLVSKPITGWTDVSPYTDENGNIVFDRPAVNPVPLSNKGTQKKITAHKFVGWYYENADGKLERFDFENPPRVEDGAIIELQPKYVPDRKKLLMLGLGIATGAVTLFLDYFTTIPGLSAVGLSVSNVAAKGFGVASLVSSIEIASLNKQISDLKYDNTTGVQGKVIGIKDAPPELREKLEQVNKASYRRTYYASAALACSVADLVNGHIAKTRDIPGNSDLNNNGWTDFDYTNKSVYNTASSSLNGTHPENAIASSWQNVNHYTAYIDGKHVLIDKSLSPAEFLAKYNISDPSSVAVHAWAGTNNSGALGWIDGGLSSIMDAGRSL